MFNTWYLIVTAAMTAGTFHGLWLSEVTLRREWRRLAQAWKNINDVRRELERRREEWCEIQGSDQRWHDSE